MSSTTSSLLHLLLLLSLAVCSCNARPIGIVKKENKLARSFHFSSKDEEKSSLARVSASSNTKPSNPTKMDSYVLENTVNEQPKSHQSVEHHELKDYQRHKVSWKLPHPKAGEQQPGFNLDYDPPRTHPGVHN